jgi:hypothetical protein
MIKTGISGGMINLKSFLNSSDRNDIKNSNLRLANIREAAKDGLTSLYAEVDDVLDKYKDTDVIKLMNELRDEKLLWVRARAIDADTVNANGDYFAKAELLKDVKYTNEKILYGAYAGGGDYCAGTCKLEMDLIFIPLN